MNLVDTASVTGALRGLFSTDGFVPRRACGLWPDWLVWEHVAGNALVWMAYVAMPVLIWRFGHRRPDWLPFAGVVRAFAVFIGLCGLGHFLDMLAFFHPMYRLSGLVLVATGLASWWTAWSFRRAWPAIMALKTTAELERMIAERTTDLTRAVDDEKRAREVQREAEGRMRSVMDHIVDGIITIDDRGIVESFNPAAERLFGHPAAEVVGRNVRILMPEPYHGEHDGYLANYRRTGQPKVIGIGREVVGRRRDGTLFPMDLAVSEFQLDDRRLFTGIVRDLTGRKRDDATHALLAAVVASSDDAIVTEDLDGSITSWNLGAERIFGHTADEAVGRHISILAPPEGAKDLDDVLARIRRGETVDHYETRRRTKDGRVVDVSLTVSPIRDAAGVVIGASKIARDITQRKRDETRIRMLSRAIEQSPVCVVITDPRGSIEYVNPRFTAVTGYTSEEVMGADHRLLLTGETSPEESRRIWETIRGGREWRGEFPNRRKDGELFEESTSISPVMDGQGGISQFVVVKEDITEKKRAEELLARRAEELMRSNRELEQFAYIASHDLQEPLRMVTAFTQRLAQRYQGRLDEKADQYIGFAVEGCQRMRRLIEDLLTYSHVTTRGRHAEPIDSGAVLAGTLGDLRNAIADACAEVTHDPMPIVLADATQLGQVFLNLVGNALKFRSAGPPRVHVSARRDDGMCTFGVADNGIGIDPQFADRIFTIFQRLHTREEYPGTGIGLAVCKKIVERHGGRIWVDTQPGQGCTFYFTIPAPRSGRQP